MLLVFITLLTFATSYFSLLSALSWQFQMLMQLATNLFAQLLSLHTMYVGSCYIGVLPSNLKSCSSDLSHFTVIKWKRSNALSMLRNQMLQRSWQQQTKKCGISLLELVKVLCMQCWGSERGREWRTWSYACHNYNKSKGIFCRK